MQRSTITINGMTLPVISVNTAVVGSGAASLNCAVQFDRYGCTDLVIITEAMGGGTSNNTGSSYWQQFNWLLEEECALAKVYYLPVLHEYQCYSPALIIEIGDLFEI